MGAGRDTPFEKLICGSELEGRAEAGGKTAFCEFFALVRKGHSECGDSAFVFADKDRIVAAVLDGVSGEPGAAMASSDAAKAILECLKTVKEPGESAVKEAMAKAHLAIRIGYTTATILHMSRDGKFIVASLGDSPAFSIDKAGKVALELKMARAVGDGDSILKFFHFRNMVTSVLGSQTPLEISMRGGTLKGGEVLILASDGLSDNLYLEVKEGYVSDSSGTKDLSRIIGKLRSPGAIVKKLLKTTETRVRGERCEEPGRVLVPKVDDIAIIAVRRI